MKTESFYPTPYTFTDMSMFAQKAVEYYLNLPDTVDSFPDIMHLNPYKNEPVKYVVKTFFNTYFNDNNERVYIIGINPGRFGGGVTGISFTDPIMLEEKLGIVNGFTKRPELSSGFIYKVIDEFGGPGLFYSRFYISAVYPFALVRDGKNFNYYDDKYFFEKLRPELIRSVQEQSLFGSVKNVLICLGKRNAEFVSAINSELKLFDRIVTLEHPRFIMQYKRRKLNDYIKLYVEQLNHALNF